jgi:hypothetical protein
MGTMVPFLSDREEPPKKTRGKADPKTSQQYLIFHRQSNGENIVLSTVGDTHTIFNCKQFTYKCHRDHLFNHPYTVKHPYIVNLEMHRQ